MKYSVFSRGTRGVRSLATRGSQRHERAALHVQAEASSIAAPLTTAPRVAATLTGVSSATVSMPVPTSSQVTAFSSPPRASFAI
jgi:hypothetical protein